MWLFSEFPEPNINTLSVDSRGKVDIIQFHILPAHVPVKSDFTR